MPCGYSEVEQSHGWTLLLAAMRNAPRVNPSDDRKARAALKELDTWDASAFRRIHSALRRLHREQDEFVFDNLEREPGNKAFVSVGRLLERLEELESSPDRVATRQADHAALATLATRGFDPATRARLAELVAIAQSFQSPPREPVAATESEKALEELNAWYEDWAETARSAITRRDLLIVMGLSKRRRRQSADDAEPASAVAVVAAPSTSTTTVALPPVTSSPVLPPAALPVLNGGAPRSLA
jgi:hypothetical protein